MKLWVDDIRNAPDDSWVVARTITVAINILRQFPVAEISLDHDISHELTMGEVGRPYPCAETFMPVCDFICAMQLYSEGGVGMKITVHTSNTVAGDEMVKRFNDVLLWPERKRVGLARRTSSKMLCPFCLSALVDSKCSNACRGDSGT